MINTTFLDYLARSESQSYLKGGEGSQLPSLQELSKELGMSVGNLREQLEVARALGLVEVRPRTGIRRRPYRFAPAVKHSLAYAMQLNRESFFSFADLRNHIEAVYWQEAVERLETQDLLTLQALMHKAWEKLLGNPIRIPHQEHRQLHLSIYSRLDNPFVLGLLEAYWDAYEAVGLNLYADFLYLKDVWGYHQKMVDAICAGNYQAGYQALVEHKDLLYQRSNSYISE